MDTKGARYANILIGIWLFISAFVWTHGGSQFTNTWIMGLIVVGISATAIGAPRMKYVNTAAGLWLIISAFALPTISTATRWNNVVVGIVVGLLSLIGTTASTATVGRPRTA